MNDEFKPTDMMYKGKTPWHGVGTQVDALATANEALNAANMNWHVEKREMWWDKNGKLENSEYFTTVRADIEKPLGIVSKKYQVLQNVDAFDFMDDLVDTGDAKYETTGVIKNGKKIWLLAKLPDSVEIADGDAMDKYLLLVNTHDGSSTVRVLTTPVRVVCENTLALALKESDNKVRISHMGNMDKKIEEARRVLGISIRNFDVATDLFRKMAQTPISDEKAAEYFHMLLPKDTTRSERSRKMLMALHKESELTDGKTVWSAYNAATDFASHYRGAAIHGPSERVLNSVVLGSGAEFSKDAMRLASILI